MKSFKFTLQTLLNVNASLEKDNKNQLKIINNKIDALQSERNVIATEIDEISSSYLQMINGSFNVDQAQICNRYMKNLYENTRILNIKIQENNGERQKVLDRLVEIITKRKSFENLKKKQYKQFLKEVQKQNEKVIEDFTSYKFNQK